MTKRWDLWLQVLRFHAPTHGLQLHGLDQSQVRLYTAIARHTVLVMAALAICAVTATLLRHRTDARAARRGPPPGLSEGSLGMHHGTRRSRLPGAPWPDSHQNVAVPHRRSMAPALAAKVVPAWRKSPFACYRGTPGGVTPSWRHMPASS